MPRPGRPYHKRTTVYYTGKSEFLKPIGKLCKGDHPHVSLSGWRNGEAPNMPTSKAAAYPPKLTDLWAKAVATAVKVS